jgi:hypothetical protein
MCNIVWTIPSCETCQSAWRAPSKDAVHSLFLMLRAYGKHVTLSEVEAALGSSAHEAANTLTLIEAAQRLDFPLQARAMTPSDLAKTQLPIIVHLERGKETGRFALLLKRYNGMNLVCESGYVTLEPLPEDVFRRYWSGYALVPGLKAANDTWFIWMVLLGTLLYFVARGPFVSIWRGLQRRKRVAGGCARLPHVGGGTALLAVLVLTGVACGQLPEEVLTTLHTVAKDLSPLEAQWEETDMIPADATHIRKEYGYLSASKERRVSFRWADTKWYALTEFQFRDQNEKRVEHELAFDGRVYYNGTKLGGSPKSLRISFITDQRIRDGYAQIRKDGYFRAAGLYFPDTSEELVKKASPLPVVLQLVTNEGATVKQVKNALAGDVRCLLIELNDDENTQIDRFFLDPKLAYAVRRHEELTSHGALLSKCECTDFTRMDGASLWIPKRCSVKYYSWERIPPQDKPVQEQLFVLDHIGKASFSAADFVVDYNRFPGTEIYNSILPEAAKAPDGEIVYRVPASPAQLENVVRQAIGVEPSRRSPRTWIIAGNIVLLIILLAFLLIRRLHRRRLSRP